jgi:hypothetical protein
MANITFNSIVSSTGTAGNFKASELWSSHATYTGNFNAVTDQVNNSNLNSINYSVSGFQSSNIAQNAILSQHLSNNAVVSAKISDSSIFQNHMVFNTASDGVRVLQCGKAGLKCARITVTDEIIGTGGTGSQEIVVSYSDAVDGDPGFTEPPVVLGPPTANAGSANRPRYWKITSINSVQVNFIYHWPVHSGTNTYTFHVQVQGF